MGFTLGARRLGPRQLQPVVRQLTGTVSVTTSFKVVVADISAGTALAATMAGASAAISAHTDSAMAAADWSDESVVTAAPTMTAPVMGDPIVNEAPTASPTSPPIGGSAQAAGDEFQVPTASPTSPPTGESAQATGDPHLANVLGQRFDLHKEGLHTLVRIPRGADLGAAFLSVEAEARQIGVLCADMYFLSVNLTGAWVGSQGRAFRAGHVANKESQRWLRYGKVELRVVQGHTRSGTVYLNLFVRHLRFAGFPVGGILGMDDHTVAATPSQKCQKRIILLAIDGPVLRPENASYAAADLE